jgi:probable HAF family extracellular repeat protein
MTSYIASRALASIIRAACCAIGIATIQAQTYSLTDLGVLPEQSGSVPAALNARGIVAGTSGDAAFRYDPANEPGLEELGSPGTPITCGFAINLSGQVVGDSTFDDSGVSHAVIFENGMIRDLAAFEDIDLFSRATGINAGGQVVGYFNARFDGQFGNAFITNISAPERDQRLTDLGTLGGRYAHALAINDSGFVTGHSEILAFGPRRVGGITHAFVWSMQTRMVDLGTLGGNSSYGTSINGYNHVAGYSNIDQANNRTHAFLHDGVTMRDLGSLTNVSEASDRSFALGVNSADEVVGYTYVVSPEGILFYPPQDDTLEQVAFVFSRGAMRDLNTVIGPAAKRYRLYSATAINDKGQITALAWDAQCEALHAVLLTPSLDIPMAKPARFRSSNR